MAQAGQNPGTTPATEPQAGGSNPTEGGAGGTTPPKRLIAGKYETLEDAVENGIFGLENAYHKTREDIAKLTRVIEIAVGGGNQNPPVDPRGGYAPVGTAGSQNYGAYGRGQPQPDDVDPQRFLLNPGEVLRERETRMMRSMASVVENVVGNAMIVADFKRQNPDLAPHERIVSAFMRETDQTKDYASRLADAARMTKEYLVSVRAASGGNQNPPPSGGNFVETPRGGGPGYNPTPVPGGGPPQQVSEEEQELMDYINERNADISARFGIKTK